MKITIYELLGMIKDDKAPKRIIFDTEIYNWCEEQEEYRRYPYNNELYKNLNSDYDISKCLNDEVEIKEEPQEHKIPEKLNYPHIEIESSADDEIRDYLYKVKDKIDEILDYLEVNND